MTPDTAAHLLALNRQFYDTYSGEFSNTRRGIPPGMQRLLSTLPAEATVLDLGCGNGRVAGFLAENNWHSRYTGLDGSERLLTEACRIIPVLPQAEFLQANLSETGWEDRLTVETYDIILAFAVLHHIPSHALRLRFVQAVHRHLNRKGRFMLSNWQFLNSARLRARIQPWGKASLCVDNVDEGDYLLDWRQGGIGLRYVHHFSDTSLAELAGEAGFHVSETFLSDGEGEKLSLYQVWEYN